MYVTDDTKLAFDGGQSHVYEFDIPEDSPPLTAYYHNHVHGTPVHGTTAYSFLSGLAGMLIVEDPEEGVAARIANAPDATA